MAKFPDIILLFSGKRKSGKDFITDKLHSKLDTCGSTIIRLAGAIKEEYARNNNLDIDQLLSTSGYKEIYRKDMIKWSEGIRAKDSDYFIRTALQMYKANQHSIWIVSDVRRQSDLEWFANSFGDKVKTIRILASMNIRKSRGFVFTPGVDDAASECNLDQFSNWNFIFQNDFTDEFEVDCFVDSLVMLCKNAKD